MLLSVHDEVLLEVPRAGGRRRWRRWCARSWRARSSSTCRSTSTSRSGDDWESMTPLERASHAMPELPEVETMARDLAPLLEGATIAEAWWDWDPVIRHPRSGGLRAAGQGPAHRATSAGAPSGWCWTSIDEAVLAIQVKMTGQLFVLPEGTVHDKHVHLRLTLDGGPVAGRRCASTGPRWLLFRDVRKFGRVGLYRRARRRHHPRRGRRGRALRRSRPRAARGRLHACDGFRERLRRRRGRLKTTLLDQSFIAGVGNIYADESLWRARLHPLRSADSLNPEQERRLYEAIRGVLNEADRAPRLVGRRLHRPRG